MLLLLYIIGSTLAIAVDEVSETDGAASRKVLGSSVVTSVSVVMDTGNGSKAIFTDAAGKPMSKPSVASDLASPINLLNPDRYEFYTFDDSGDLVKRLMTLDEIQGIIASGDGDGFNVDALTSQDYLPEKRVDDVVNNVQNVLKEEMQSHKDDSIDNIPIFDTPDVSDSWSMILPAIFGNSGQAIKPEKPVAHVTPDTIMIEPITTTSKPISTTKTQFKSSTENIITSNHKSTTPRTSSSTVNYFVLSQRPITSTSTLKSSSLSENSIYSSPKPLINNVEIISNAEATEAELTKDNALPIYHVSSSTTPRSTTSRPVSSTTRRSTTRDSIFSKRPVSVSTKPILSLATHPVSSTTIKTTATTTTKPLKTTTELSYTSMETLTTKNLETTEKDLTTENILENKLSSTLPSIKITNDSSIIKFTNNIESTEKLPSLSEILNQNKIFVGAPTIITTTPDPTTEVTEVVTTDKIMEENSSIVSLVPVLSVNNDLQSTTIEPETTTKYLEPTTLQTNTIDNIMPERTTRPFFDEDLSASSTKFVTFSSFNDNQTNFANELTTENMKKNQLTTTEKLDNFVLTSTNIYEINSELSEKPIDTGINSNHKFVTVKYTTPSKSTAPSVSNSNPMLETTSSRVPQITFNSTNLIPVTEENIYSTTELPTTTTTEESLIDTIDKLIGEALGDEAGHVDVSNANNYTDNVTNVITNSTNQNDVKLLPETTTITLSLIDSTKKDLPTTTEENSNFESIVTTSDKIANEDKFVTEKTDTISTEHIQEKLSNISNKNSFTTLSPIQTSQYLIPSTKPYEISYGEALLTSTLDSLIEATTIRNNIVDNNNDEKQTTGYIENGLVETTTVEDFTPVNKPQNYTPHIINITILSHEENVNHNKPAKLDTRLEENVQNPNITNKNITKTITKFSNINMNEILKTQGTSTILHDSEQVQENFTENTNTLISTTQPNLDETTLTTNTESTNLGITYFDFDKTTTDYQLSTTKTNDGLITKQETLTNLVTTTVKSVNNQATTLFSDVPKLNLKYTPKPSIVILISENKTEVPAFTHNLNKEGTTWSLVPTISPHNNEKLTSDIMKTTIAHPITSIIEPAKPVDLVPKPLQGFGLEDSTSHLDTDIYQFAQLCNELAFGFWKSVTNGISQARSVIVSPFAATSLLAMVFLGARGATSGEMNEILKLDDMVTFNPHLIFKNVSESIDLGSEYGVAVSTIVRELYSDRSKGDLLNFYKERARQFYDGHVEEANFREIGDVIRRRTNLLIKKQTNGKISEFLKDNSITVKPPLAAVSTSIFHTDCSQASIDGRDGELHFIVLPSIRQRRLIPVPAVVYRSGFLAGYEPSLDATAVAIGSKDHTVSTIFIIPGQQGIAAPGDGLTRLEKRLVESSFKKGAWSRLLRALIPRPGLEIQIPRFSHRSIINATVALKKMGLKDLFDANKADLRGLNGAAHELYLSDMLQINNFATCGEDRIGDTHHSEIYPATGQRSLRKSRMLEEYQSARILNAELEEPRDYQRSFHDPSHDPSYLALPLPLRPRQARIPEAPRLRFDRPFLYFVRHNPTGLILHMGRFNPRLLP